MSKPRVAFLTSEYPAVSHTFIQREVLELRRRGLEVLTFSVRRADPKRLLSDEDRREFATTVSILPASPLQLLGAQLKPFSRRPGAYVRTFARAMQRRTRGVDGVLRWGGYFVEAMVLAEALNDAGVTHVHNHFANASANVAMLAAEYQGIPWSFVFHGVFELDWPGVGALADKIASASFAVCISDFNRAWALRSTPTERWADVIVSRCGLEMSENPRAPRTQTGPFRFVSVARLSKEKGIPGLVEAFAALKATGVDATLTLVGDGPEEAAVRRAVDAYGLSSSVTFAGILPPAGVRDALHSADALVMSSLMEGLPVVLMEAMAAGVPVIAPRLAGIPELVEHDVTGLLFAPARFDELSAAMKRLATDEALCRRLADAGHDKVHAQHDIRRAVEPLWARLTGAA